MSIAHLLRDFGSGDPRDTISISQVSLEDERLESFEKGYKAGWDDAIKAQEGDRTRISADFAANLQDLSFTCQEAQAGLLAGLRPLLTGMVETVLPRLAHATLGVRVIELLEEQAKQAGDAPAQIVTSPADAGALESLLETVERADVTVRPEPSLGEGQVHIRVGESEARIDLDAVLREIEAAVSGFFENMDHTARAPAKERA
ncbi:flagellar biosynthesis protein [Roseovarius spongiae]|uniref:Flagellar biosynthesis protein n=1 Tax=Roseovarius spongiae TaxID=2320272 RepID=A0A3A8ASD8_9RHOB|nr:flagellar biosynthesis protein [Roseovarius spongiae]RKF13031.1 flagellar biosynthesis protein [Roseovarius spongiae]